MKYFVPLLCFLYVLWNAQGLIWAWYSSPLDAFGWIPFCIWILPVLWVYKSPKTSLLLGALLTTLLGVLGGFNTLHYIALSFCIASITPFSLVWLITAISWMPAFGWSLHTFNFQTIFILRVIVATFGALWLTLSHQQKAYL